MFISGGDNMAELKKKKDRVIQEYVPGKQVTLVHLIAHPSADIYKKIGLNEKHEALGILTITPARQQ